MADQPIPQFSVPVIDPATGRMNRDWYTYLMGLKGGAALDEATSDKAVKTQTVCASFSFAFFDDGTQRVIINSPFAWSITNITVRTRAGTVSVTPKINGSALSGGAIAASTTEATEATTGNVAVGDDVELQFASTSADCEGLTVTLAGTRVLA